VFKHILEDLDPTYLPAALTKLAAKHKRQLHCYGKRYLRIYNVHRYREIEKIPFQIQKLSPSKKIHFMPSLLAIWTFSLVL